MRTDCTNGQGIVTAVISNPVEVPPPNPFSLGDLQKDAYRNFGITPSKTLKIVERLYLNALVSYPRTTSQKLSASIDYKAILRRLGRLPEYSTIVEELLNRALRPAEGTKFDQAHPAIHPTGEPPEKHLDSLHMRVYDMIVRRFFAVVAPSAKRELTTLTVRVGGYEFKAAGGRTVTPGWTSYYGKYWKTKDHELPFILEGEHLQVTELKVDEMFDERPFRYNQSTLLEKMERERIGTKATRSDVIDTLIRRGYVAGESLVATELGFSVVESMEEHAPSVVSTGLTRGMEAQLERIERGSRMDGNLVRETVRSVSEQLIELSRNNEAIGRQIGSAFAATNAAGYILGPCPVCRIGDLRVVRSARTRKRFAGCTNYSAGCKASAPLPQCGNIIRTNTGCQSCLWPIIQIAGDRWPWRFCINPKCPSKRR
jgi:DNA topoisomerase-1